MQTVVERKIWIKYKLWIKYNHLVFVGKMQDPVPCRVDNQVKVDATLSIAKAQAALFDASDSDTDSDASSEILQPPTQVCDNL